jgi:hypothetical protein
LFGFSFLIVLVFFCWCGVCFFGGGVVFLARRMTDADWKLARRERLVRDQEHAERMGTT